ASSPARRPGPSGSSDRAEASTDSGGRASSASGGDGSNLDSVRDNLDRSDESGGDEDPVEKLEALDQALEEQSSAEDSSRSGTGND
ncbi:MAG: hypothetical protein ABEL76_12605, partial [Bradymonadaceae bacterium]